MKPVGLCPVGHTIYESNVNLTAPNPFFECVGCGDCFYVDKLKRVVSAQEINNITFTDVLIDHVILQEFSCEKCGSIMRYEDRVRVPIITGYDFKFFCVPCKKIHHVRFKK
jgi:hypothetical protein